MQKFPQPIVLSDLDYEGIAQSLDLTDGKMTLEDFERLMRDQLKLYTQSRLSSMSEFWAITDKEFTTIGTLKHILMEQINIKQQLNSIAPGLSSSGVMDVDTGNIWAGPCPPVTTAKGEDRSCDTGLDWMRKASELQRRHNIEMRGLMQAALSGKKAAWGPDGHGGAVNALEESKGLGTSPRGRLNKSVKARARPKSVDDMAEAESESIIATSAGSNGYAASSTVSGSPKAGKATGRAKKLRRSKSPQRSNSPRRAFDSGTGTSGLVSGVPAEAAFVTEEAALFYAGTRSAVSGATTASLLEERERALPQPDWYQEGQEVDDGASVWLDGVDDIAPTGVASASGVPAAPRPAAGSYTYEADRGVLRSIGEIGIAGGAAGVKVRRTSFGKIGFHGTADDRQSFNANFMTAHLAFTEPEKYQSTQSAPHYPFLLRLPDPPGF